MPLSASNCLLHQVRQRDEALRERSRAARALNALHAEKRELQWALGDLRTSPLHAETSLAFSEGHVVLRSPGALGSEIAPRLYRDCIGALRSEQQLTSRDNTEVAKEVLREAFAAAKTPSTPVAAEELQLGRG